MGVVNKKPSGVVTQRFIPEHPIHLTTPPNTHLGFQSTGKRARMTRSRVPVCSGSAEGVKCFQLSHTPALNTFLIVHTDGLLAQEKKKEFSKQAKHLSFPKCHKISESHISFGETFIGLSSF